MSILSQLHKQAKAIVKQQELEAGIKKPPQKYLDAVILDNTLDTMG